MGPAPSTSTLSPRRMSVRRVACSATVSGSTMAASTSSSASGAGVRRRASAAMAGAKPPWGVVMRLASWLGQSRA